MATAQAIPEPVIDYDFNEKDEDVIEAGNWTEDRKEILKNLTGEEIDADIMRQQEECPERFSTREEIDAKIMRLEQALANKRRAEMVGA